MVTHRGGFLLCAARGFGSGASRVRVSAGTSTAAASSSSSSSSGPSSSSSSDANSTPSSAVDHNEKGQSSSSRTSATQQPPKGYGKFVPQRFQRYTSGTAVGDFNMFRKAFVRTQYAEYTHQPMEVKWKGILEALKPLGRISTDNTITPYYDTGDAYRAMWKSVEEATESVKWQTYICKDDNVGKETVRRIEEAHDRGLAVELLYDCGGNITGRTRLTQGLVHRSRQSNSNAGDGNGSTNAPTKTANVIAYRPFLINLYRYYRNGMRWQHSPALRSHRKILIVDGDEGYAGGLNVGDDYCAKDVGGNGRFRDTHCKVVGPAVKHLQEVYDDTITPAQHALTPWRSITAASARKRLQYLKSKARQQLKKSRAHNGNAMRESFNSAKAGATNTLQRMKVAVKRRSDQLSAFKFRSPKLPTGSGGAPTRLEFARSIRFMKTQAYTLKAAATAAGAKAAASASRAGHKAVDAVEQRLEKAVNTAHESQGTIYALPATDDQPIPEASAFDKEPSQTQILMCNPLTLDWSLPMAMWLVTQDAHRRVWVTTPYYLPHRKLTAAIINTARRGVDVRIIAGSRTTTDPWFMWYASQFVTLRFLQAGVRVYEFEGGQIMHAKTVVVDSVWSSVGSYNWDVMSNKLLEVSVTTFGKPEAMAMEDHFRRDLAKSREITLEEFMNRSLWRRAQCAFFYYGMRFAEWMSFWNYYDPQIDTNQE